MRCPRRRWTGTYGSFCFLLTDEHDEKADRQQCAGHQRPHVFQAMMRRRPRGDSRCVFRHKKASASTLETEAIFQYTKSVINAKTAAPDYSDATVKYLQMCDFWGILPTSTRIGIRLAHVGIQPSFSVS